MMLNFEHNVLDNGNCKICHKFQTAGLKFDPDECAKLLMHFPKTKSRAILEPGKSTWCCAPREGFSSEIVRVRFSRAVKNPEL